MRPQIRFNERFFRAVSVRQNYQSHKRKLSQLSLKKGPYAINSSLSKLEQIKFKKNNQFIRNRSKKLQAIDKQNNTILGRLVGSQDLSRNTCVANATIAFLKEGSVDKILIDKPYFHRVLKEAQSQNQRLFGKLTTLKSTIDRKKMISDYNVYNQRKNRISKFQGLSLKKNRFVQKQFLRRSISNRSTFDNNLTQPISIKDAKSSTTTQSTQHYNSLYSPQQILKNKVQNTHISIKNRIKQLHKVSFKPFNNKLVADISKFVDQKISNQHKKFFATEVQNVKPRCPSLGLKDIRK